MLGPLNESKDDADLHADECCCGKYAMFYASKFIPWDFESPIRIIADANTNEKESWLEAWTANIETLQTQACNRTHREDDLAMATCKSDTWA